MDDESITSSFIFGNKNVISNRTNRIDFNKIKRKSMTSFYKNRKVMNYGIIIQNLKLDIQSLQDSIRENSEILIYYKNPKM